MNKERFLELAEQAGFIFWADESWRPEGDTIDWSSNYDEELTKFAELIVRECMHMVDAAEWGCMTHGLTTHAEGCQLARRNIAENFGIEE
jgi:hypothetical protein